MAQHLLDAVEHELARIVFQPSVADRGVLQRQVLADERQRNVRGREALKELRARPLDRGRSPVITDPVAQAELQVEVLPLGVQRNKTLQYRGSRFISSSIVSLSEPSGIRPSSDAMSDSAQSASRSAKVTPGPTFRIAK